MKHTDQGISGINAAMTAAMAERFLQDPRSVQQHWREAFEAMSHQDLEALAGPEAVAIWKVRHGNGQTNGHTNGHAANGAASGVDPAVAAAGWQVADQIRLEWAVQQLVAAYRAQGHKYANINPLAPTAGGLHINPAAFGITQDDLDKPAPTDVPLPQGATVRDLLGALEATWCGSIGAEVMHLEDTTARDWLLARMEGTYNRAAMTPERQRWLMDHINDATLMEDFLDKKFVGAKRFSVEGGESLLPLLHAFIESAGEHGVEDIVLGMAHRGRLNVMVNILGKSPGALFHGFRDGDAEANLGGGDVKYHNGLSRDIATPSGQEIHVSLCFNPSHLEFVNPVVLGRARAKQECRGDADGAKVVPLLIHGDAAVVGQGIVAESLNLARLEGYSTGGTIHIVVNNQVGFTTEPHEDRSTRYATDIARWIGAPVLHVNGDDPEAAVHAAQVACEYRQRFGGDVFIDLVCYRRYGHNEGDEPRYTQPTMYQRIDSHPTLRTIYAQRLIQAGIITADQDSAMVAAWNEQYAAAFKASLAEEPEPPTSSMQGAWSAYKGGADADVEEPDTGVDKETLSELIRTMTTPPEGFAVHDRLQRKFFNPRSNMAEGKVPLDWGTAEALAYATLLQSGASVRISGQDARRGTFAHRYAILRDTVNGQRWNTLEPFCQDGAAFTVWNSPLSEAAVMGFDWGYSLDRPESLTIWEAQFGDFANGAQVIIDQFLASSEDKWNRLSGLVLLLPHGFAGQGPEHSSARLERFLCMCAEDNMQVCNPTTPAQIFHLLRRQIVRPLRKPLVIMSPKSLLRMRSATSSLEELAEGRFQRILPDNSETAPADVKRVLMCSGRIYYDLERQRTKLEANDTAIIRFEQLYPLSDQDILTALEPYLHAELVWIQDEPWNMGPWMRIQATLRSALGERNPGVKVISRAESASPATGWKSSHKYEAARLMEFAFGERSDDKHNAVCLSDV